MGATATGHDSGTPSSARAQVDLAHVDQHVLLDGQAIEVAAVAALASLSVSAAPSPKFQWSRGSFSWAARRISGSVTNLGPVGVGVMAVYYTPKLACPGGVA